MVPMSKEYAQTYFEVWGEMPPQPDEPSADAAQAESHLNVPEIRYQPAEPPRLQPVASADAQTTAETALDRKANEVIQRMMVDTLRRVESRLAMMDEHQADSHATIPSAVQDLYEQLSKMADEIARFLQRTRRINEELAGIQIESAKNLALIAKKVKELESRPLHWPPR